MSAPNVAQGSAQLGGQGSPHDLDADAARVVVTVSAAVLARAQEHGLAIEVRCRPDRGPELRARVAGFLAEHPTATANAVHLAIGGRRADVLRAVRSVRGTQGDAEHVSHLEAAPTRFLSPGYQGVAG